MSANQTILVIDDELNFCKILEAKLRRSNYDVALAYDAASGLRLLLTHRYDAVLLDIHLPDGAGIDLLSRFRAVSPGTPFILMTAYEEENLRVRAILAGAEEVLYKPFDLDHLVQTIRQQIGKAPARVPESTSRMSLLPLGQDILIKLGANGVPNEIAGRITGKSGDEFAVVSKQPIPPLGDDRVSVRVTGEDGEYRFNSRIIARENNGGMLTLRKPAVITRHQRRKYPRAPLNVPVVIYRREVGDTRSLDNAGRECCEGMARNISLNGIEVALARPMAPQDLITICWSFRSDDVVTADIAVNAKVIRCESVEEGSTMPVYRAAVQFQRMSRQARGHIRSHVESRL